MLGISRGGRGLTEVHVRETLRGTSPELAAGARETYYECHPFIYFVPGSTYLKWDIDRHTEPRSGGSWKYNLGFKETRGPANGIIAVLKDTDLGWSSTSAQAGWSGGTIADYWTRASGRTRTSRRVCDGTCSSPCERGAIAGHVQMIRRSTPPSRL